MDEGFLSFTHILSAFTTQVQVFVFSSHELFWIESLSVVITLRTDYFDRNLRKPVHDFLYFWWVHLNSNGKIIGSLFWSWNPIQFQFSDAPTIFDNVREIDREMQMKFYMNPAIWRFTSQRLSKLDTLVSKSTLTQILVKKMNCLK